MTMMIYLDSSLFGEQSALVVDVVDQRFEAIISLGDPGAREGICSTDIRLQYFCYLALSFQCYKCYESCMVRNKMHTPAS